MATKKEIAKVAAQSVAEGILYAKLTGPVGAAATFGLLAGDLIYMAYDTKILDAIDKGVNAVKRRPQVNYSGPTSRRK